MTELARHLARRIAVDGPMTMAGFMAECLTHPTLGYYSTRDPLGAAGDFTTAPEISQMFGELLGLALAQTWQDQGAPADAIIVELGPGRGTLMSDMRRAARTLPSFAALPVHFIETSPALRKLQADAVPQAIFHDTIETLPDAPIFLVANEFFDALPIRQFQRDPAGWRERVVGLEGETLTLGLSDPIVLPALRSREADTPDGAIVEQCPALPSIVGEIGARIAARGGCGIIIDYGDWHSLGDTLQAVKDHAPTDILSCPGAADLTAHVDFAALAEAAAPALHSRVTPQGVFLERLGITARAQALANGLAGDALDAHIAAHRRLTHPEEMGNLFKVIGLYPEGAAPPPGLAA